MRNNTTSNFEDVLERQQKPYDTETLLQQINAEEVKSLMPLIIFYSLILIVGVVGNFLVLLVYTFRYKRSPARIFILFLASIDFSLCLFGLPYHMIDLTHPYTFTSGITCKLLTFVITSLFYMSVFGLIVIAIDRYLNICKPLSHLHISFFKKRRACFGAVISALLFSWPNLVLYGQSEMEGLNTNVTGYACYYDTKYLDTNYPLMFTLSILLVCVSSTIFLVVVYLLIYIEIYRSYHGIAKAKSVSMNYDCVSQTDEFSLRSFGGHKSKPKSRVHFITRFDRANRSDKSHIESQQNHKINVIYNPKNKCSLNNNQNGDVTKSLLNNENENRRLNKCLIENSDNNRRRDDVCPTSNDVGKTSHQRRMFEQEYGIESNEKTKNCICHEEHKLHSSSSKSSSSPKEGSSNSENIDEIIQIDTDKECCNTYTHAHDDRTMFDINDTSKTISYGSNKSVNSVLKPKNLLNLLSSKSVECVANSTGSLDNKPRQGGFPMCRPQRVKRRSLSHFGIKASPGRCCQRSASLGNINGVNLGPGMIRFKSSSSGSVCKSIRNRHSTSTKGRHSKITKIMLTITIVFLLSYSPALIVTILSVIKPDIWDIMSVRETIVCEFFLRFYLVNNVCNPFIYGFWDKRFLREIHISFKKLSQRIKDIFCCC